MAEQRQPTMPDQEVLPPNWHRVFSADGRPYYQNDVTHQTSWEKPVESPALSTSPVNSQPVPTTTMPSNTVLAAQSQSGYVRDKMVEKKGKMKWDKYVQRHLRLRPGAVLEYWTVVSLDKSNGAVQESTLKNTLNLLDEGLNEVKANKNKGMLFKYGWQLQTDGRTYLFASPNDQERKGWIKQIQDTYAQAVTSKPNAAGGGQEQETKQPHKSWGASLKGLTDAAKEKGGLGAALKTFQKDMVVIKAEKTRVDRQSKHVTATLDTSSIFGCYGLVDDNKKKAIAAGAAMDEKTDDGAAAEKDGVVNQHSLMTLTLEQLLLPGVHSYEAVLGSKALRFNRVTSFNDDLVVSNEFCQLAIGKGLIGHAAAVESAGVAKADNALQVNKRPKDAVSDDEDDADDKKQGSTDDDGLPAPQVRHDGTLREKIEFHPGNKDFLDGWMRN